ncbi:DUF5701 family protein [Streptomyces boncukensis]|uniref:DUF5701 family protein n=1 Tax=Streptomyces boncukensis TaxID=2711219 RepID=UPI001F494A76|nr:DUF5701 family protein [Streptomyces boncukensis]
MEKGYPDRAGISPEEFTKTVAPLRDVAVRAAAEPGAAPFVLVVTRSLVPVEEMVELTRLESGTKPGIVDRHYEEGSLARFVPVEGAEPPAEPAYLLLGADRGEEFCGAVPRDAMAAIAERGRTLLTIEEGLAFVTQYPAALAKNKCFSLGASRCGDRRVPAIWISQRAPKLGWCWEGNPHTWLGMASAAGRAG